MDQQEPIQAEYEEIDLMDYVKVILKRKWLIFGIFLGAAIVAGIFSFLMPKIYKIDTSLEIGQITEMGQITGKAIEAPGQIVEKIKEDVYGIFVREKLGISESEYPNIKAEDLKGTQLIKMVIESANPPKAKNILGEINNLILAEHQEKIKVKKELIGQDIKTTEDKIKLVESDVKRIENKTKTIQEDIQTTRNKIKPIENDIERITIKIGNAEEEKENLEAKVEALQKVLPYQQDPGTQFALFDTKEKLANKKQEIENLYLQINSLRRTIEDYNLQINSLERTIEDYNSQVNSLKTTIESLNAQINALKASLDEIKPTQVIKSPTVSESPIKPRIKLNIVIAAILGLFIGVFLAFFQEWWEKSKVKS